MLVVAARCYTPTPLTLLLLRTRQRLRRHCCLTLLFTLRSNDSDSIAVGYTALRTRQLLRTVDTHSMWCTRCYSDVRDVTCTPTTSRSSLLTLRDKLADMHTFLTSATRTHVRARAVTHAVAHYTRNAMHCASHYT